MFELDPKVIGSLGFAGVFEILLPIAVGLWVWWKYRVRWTLFALGALAFAASQLFTRIPLVVVLQNVLKESLKDPTVMWIWIAGLALTAGLFEETARYLCFRYAMKGELNWRNAVALGTGHGGLESAVLVGLSVLSSVVFAVMLSRGLIPTANLSPEDLAGLEKAKETFIKMRWWEPLLGAYERVVSMAVHISLSVVVLQRFLRKQMGWYWFAVLYHASSNLIAVVVLRQWGALAAEAALTPFLLFSLWMIVRFKNTPAPRLEVA